MISMRVTCIVEQPRNEPQRIRYQPSTGEFIKTDSLSLMHARSFMGVYGWMADSGTPPEPHFDIMIVTAQDCAAGDSIEAQISGMFLREDGDHKFVALADDIIHAYHISDISLPKLPEELRSNIFGVYPRLNPGEAWLDAPQAIEFLQTNTPTSPD